jgi:hypothetical protein
MASYLRRLEAGLREAGLGCPLFLMLSGGGLTTLETAARFPIRLVESGPAGGAIFAAHVARQKGWGRVLSFDMGGHHGEGLPGGRLRRRRRPAASRWRASAASRRAPACRCASR